MPAVGFEVMLGTVTGGVPSGDPSRGGNGRPPRAEAGLEIGHAARPGRMAFHAMADRDQIGAAPDGIGQHRLAESGVGVGIGIAPHRDLVDGIGDFVADRRHAAQIGNDGVEVVGQQRLVEIRRHDRRQRNAGKPAMVRARSLDERALDLGVAPASDPGFPVRRDVGRGGGEGRRIEGEAARQFPPGAPACRRRRGVYGSCRRP